MRIYRYLHNNVVRVGPCRGMKYNLSTFRVRTYFFCVPLHGAAKQETIMRETTMYCSYNDIGLFMTQFMLQIVYNNAKRSSISSVNSKFSPLCSTAELVATTDSL